jgi:type II secretory pathway component PulC
MPDGARSKLPVIATVLAGVAVACAVAAIIVVLRRDRDAPAPSVAAKPPVQPALIDRRVQASDANKLRDIGALDTVIEAGVVKGVRVKDPALAVTLGFDTGDVLVALSGRPVTSERDLRDAMFLARTSRVTTLYVEMLRGTTPMLMRWQLDGDLHVRPQLSAGLGLPLPSGLGGRGPGSLYGTTPSAPDPLLDTIEKIDDNRFRLPRSTLETILSDPYGKMLGSARVVPSVKNGVPNGFKIYAVRPSSFIAQLGLTNGDTIHSIAGEELTSVSDPAALFERLKNATSFSIDITRRGRPVLIDYEITK